MVPDQTTAYDSTACCLDAVATEYTGMSTYQSLFDHTAFVGGSYKGLIIQASFSLSYEY